MDQKTTDFFLERNIVVISGEMTPDVLTEVIKNLAQIRFNGSKSATLLIDTQGGACTEGLQAIDKIKMLGLELTGIVVGKCHSMGVPILQICTHRKSAPHSWFLIHSVYTRVHIRAYDADAKEIMTRAKEDIEKHQDCINSILAKRSGLSEDKIRELTEDGNKNFLLSAQKALELNLIDEIVEGHTIPY